MAVDFGLDRVGAGQSGLFGHERGDCAQRESGDVPKRLERGRAHPPLGHQGIEARQMAVFLRGHARDQLGFRAVAAEHGELAGIDARRAIFARLVDAEHRRAVGPASPGRQRLIGATPERQEGDRAAPPSDRIAFHPAMEMPRNDHCTSSQRTSGVATICFSRSAVVPPWRSRCRW